MATIIQFDGSKGDAKVVHEVVHLRNDASPYLSDEKISEIRGRGLEFDAPALSELLRVNKSQITRRCAAGKYVNARQVLGNGGMQWRIPLNDVLPELRSDVREWLIKALRGDQEVEKQEPKISPFDQMPQKSRDKALIRYEIVRLYKEAIDRYSHGSIIEAKAAFEQRFNAGEWPYLLEQLGRPVSWRSIDTHWMPKLKESGGLPSSLAPQYKYTRTGKKHVSMSAIQKETVLALYLDTHQRPIAEICRQANWKLNEMGARQVSYNVVRRYINDYTAAHGSEVVLAREGEKAYNDKQAAFIRRNRKLSLLGDDFEADGHKLNFVIDDPFKRMKHRMTMIMHIEPKSKMVLGWEIMPSENIHAVGASLRRSMLHMGYLVTDMENVAFVPRHMRIDNGRAFTADIFTAKKFERMSESGLSGLFEELKAHGFIKVDYSKPYHGQSKTIERIFNNFGELERSVESYSGTSIQKKPAHLMRGEFFHRELAAVLNHRESISLTEAHLLVAGWVDIYNNTPVYHAKDLRPGQTPLEAFQEHLPALQASEGFAERCIPGDYLRFLLMEQTTRTLTRNGIRLFGREYLSDELADMANGRRKFVIRYDLARLGSVLVFHENMEFVCEAREWCPNGGIHPHVLTLGDAEQVAAFREAAKSKEDAKKRTMKQVKQQVLGYAKNGFSGFVGREVLPDVARQIEEAGQRQALQEKALLAKSGTNDEPIPEEFILRPEEAPEEFDLGMTWADFL